MATDNTVTSIDLDDFEDDPAGLRKAIKALQRERDDLRSQVSELSTAGRTSQIDSRFTELGIPDKFKSLIGKDTDLDEWFETYGADLATKKPGAQEGAEGDGSEAEGDDGPTDEEQRQNDTRNSASKPPAGGSPSERLKNASSAEERAEVMKQEIARFQAAGLA